MSSLPSQDSLRGRAWFLLLSAVLLPAVVVAQELKRRPDSAIAPPDVLSASKLSPPLLGSAYIRYNRDGTLLLIQNDAGISVLSRNPLKLLLFVEITDAYPAVFSEDSQAVVVFGHNLVLHTLQPQSPSSSVHHQLPAKDGCLDARLSPNADWLICLTPGLVLDVYRTSDLQRVYSQQLSNKLDVASARFRVRFPIALRYDSPFAGPFGFSAARDFEPLANRGLLRAGITFSPDSRFLLLDEQSDFYRIDLASLTKASLPGSLRKHQRGIVGIVPPKDDVLVSEQKDQSYKLVSLTNGDVVSSLSLPADIVSLASDPRYALLARFGSPSVTVFDLEKNISLPIPANLGADVHAGEVAILNAEGQLLLSALERSDTVAGGRLPLGPLHSLRSALADPSLSTLAISLLGGGATFDTATGHRISATSGFRGVTFGGADSAFLVTPRLEKPFHLVQTVSHWIPDPEPAATASDWTAERAVELVSSLRALVSYSFYNFAGGSGPMIEPGGEIQFELRGLDLSTGHELWRHRYDSDPPLPFADPQGSRIVLGWKANADAARRAAKSFPAVRDAYKKEKIKDLDSFFEVVDASTGASVGGVLIQYGSGPSAFDSAYSAGNLLFIAKDAYRLSVFQLSDGKLLGRLRGERAAVSEQARIFALEDENGNLAIYSSENAAKLALRPLPDPIAYLRFSEKGDRLLVVTAHQQALILDVQKTLAEFPAPASEIPAKDQ